MIQNCLRNINFNIVTRLTPCFDAQAGMAAKAQGDMATFGAKMKESREFGKLGRTGRQDRSDRSLRRHWRRSG